VNNWKTFNTEMPPLDTPVLVWLDEGNKPDVDTLIQLSPSDGGEVQFVKRYVHNYTHWRLIDAPTGAGGEQ
jgi:hypothetical protein